MGKEVTYSFIHKPLFRLTRFKIQHTIDTTLNLVTSRKSLNEMASLTELQPLVKATITPWQQSKEKPPFSYGELIAMALVMTDHPKGARDIMFWVIQHFKYYNKLACYVFTSNRSDDYGTNRSQPKDIEASDFSFKFYRTLLNFRLPLHTTCYISQKSPEWTIAPAEARVYLQNALGWKPSGVFPFFRLPAELRTIIYELVFAYPSVGLYRGTLQGNINGKNFMLRSRDFSEPVSFAEREGGHDQCFRMCHVIDTESVSEILSPILTNKQMFQEASHIFYSINTFFFGSVEDILIHIEHLPESRRQHFGHIAFTYNDDRSYDKHAAPRAFKLLADIPNLRKVSINLNEAKLASRYLHQPEENYDVTKIPGFSVLRKIRGLEAIEFVGDCPKVAAILKAQLTQPAKVGADKVGLKPKKRKADEGDMGSGRVTKARK